MVNRTRLAKLPRYSYSVRAASVTRHVRDTESFTLWRGFHALTPTKAVDALFFSVFEGSSGDSEASFRACRERPGQPVTQVTRPMSDFGAKLLFIQEGKLVTHLLALPSSRV